MTSSSSLAVVTLAGELDMARRDELTRVLSVEAPGPAILVDLIAVTYADSTAISQILRFRNEAERFDRKIALLIGGPHLKRVLQYAGLSEVFAVFEDRGEALTYLASAP